MVEVEIDKMLKCGVIEFLFSLWVFLIVLVCKKDGIICFCVDYCKLNFVMVKDFYLFLCIDDFIDVLFGFC